LCHRFEIPSNFLQAVYEVQVSLVFFFSFFSFCRHHISIVSRCSPRAVSQGCSRLFKMAPDCPFAIPYVPHSGSRLSFCYPTCAARRQQTVLLPSHTGHTVAADLLIWGQIDVDLAALHMVAALGSPWQCSRVGQSIANSPTRAIIRHAVGPSTCRVPFVLIDSEFPCMCMRLLHVMNKEKSKAGRQLGIRRA
jgi:hypothetical protein